MFDKIDQTGDGEISLKEFKLGKQHPLPFSSLSYPRLLSTLRSWNKEGIEGF